jgi:hypothetical protein
VSAGADPVALANGCIWCSIRDDPADVMGRVVAADPPPGASSSKRVACRSRSPSLKAPDRPALAAGAAVEATICLADADQIPTLDDAAMAFGRYLSISRVPQTVEPWLVANIQSPLIYLLVVNIILLVFGCFMEALAAMLIPIPILGPAAIALGVDPVHFGLVFVLNLMIGTVTPPVGVVLFGTIEDPRYVVRGDKPGDRAVVDAVACGAGGDYRRDAPPQPVAAESSDGTMMAVRPSAMRTV